jgi:hypothetical protein
MAARSSTQPTTSRFEFPLLLPNGMTEHPNPNSVPGLQNMFTSPSTLLGLLSPSQLLMLPHATQAADLGMLPLPALPATITPAVIPPPPPSAASIPSMAVSLQPPPAPPRDTQPPHPPSAGSSSSITVRLLPVKTEPASPLPVGPVLPVEPIYSPTATTGSDPPLWNPRIRQHFNPTHIPLGDGGIHKAAQPFWQQAQQPPPSALHDQ